MEKFDQCCARSRINNMMVLKRMAKVTLCILAMSVCDGTAEVLQNVTVSTKYGHIKGQRHRENYDIGEGALTDTVDVFMGIPYAAPPIGDLRFQRTHPPKPWPGIMEALVAGPICPQLVYYSQTDDQNQSEDCLSLNIYSPVLTGGDTSSLPVMVFIHGGSYEEGTGSRYNGFTLAQHGVVVVTINYRLGVLGFLTNGEKSLPGNYGLMDQIESLRWLSQNVGYFRGDACKVTLFGSSAGSASIGLLLVSPLARGLFERVILESGSPISFWAVYNETVKHQQFFSDVATMVGCPEEAETMDKIECLKKVHYSNFSHYHWDHSNCSNIADAEIKRLLDNSNTNTFPRIVPSKLNFKPRVDGYVLPDRPRSMFLALPRHNVTAMIGTLQDEWARSMGWFFNDMEHADPDLTDGFDRDSFERSIHHVIRTRFSWPREVADAAMFMYTDWTNVTDSYVNRNGYKDLMSDLVMVAPSMDLADILTQKGSTIFYYNYNHTSIFTDPPWWKCYHSLELDSVFGSPFTGYNIAVDSMRNHTAEDNYLSRLVMLLWTNFAKTGNPTPAPVGDITWPQMEVSLNNYLHIAAEEVTMRSYLRADKMAFWNKLVPSLMGVRLMYEGEENVIISADMNSTLMWFFGILSVLSFAVTIAVVVRSGSLQTQLNKALANPAADV